MSEIMTAALVIGGIVVVYLYLKSINPDVEKDIVDAITGTAGAVGKSCNEVCEGRGYDNLGSPTSRGPSCDCGLT